MSLSACQVLSGLDELKEGGANAGAGGSGAAGGGADGGQGGTGGEPPSCQPIDDSECTPANCKGGCDPEDACVVDCPTAAGCVGLGEITCQGVGPGSAKCIIHCEADECRERTIRCSEDNDCRIICEGTGACVGAEIICGNGSCELECSDQGCKNNGRNGPDTTLQCGGGPCSNACSNSLGAVVTEGACASDVGSMCAGPP